MKIKLTQALKDHAVKSFGVKSDAPDARFCAVIGAKLLSGALSGADYANLSGSKGAAGAVTNPPAPKTTPVAPAAAPLPADLDRMIDQRLEQRGFAVSGTDVTPEFVLSKSAASNIRVKSAAESYNRSRKAAVIPERYGRGSKGLLNPNAGQAATFHGRVLEHPSDLDKAVAASYLKWSLRNQLKSSETPYWARMTDHDWDLFKFALHEMPWSGYVGNRGEERLGTRVNRRKFTELETKALLDDSISGGIEVAPVVFDEAIILYPVLYGEIFPRVNVVNINRGRRMHGASMINPTFTSGVAEGTAITPFNTAAFTSAFDTTIYAAVGAMEIGQDWEEDSPVDLGSQIIEQYGLKALEWLDRVIAVGDGVSEPLGVFNSTGTTAVPSDNSAGGPPTMSDLEGLLFGLPKQFRNEPGSDPIYLSNDTMYRRVRGIQVGPGDERRILGYVEEEYKALGRPWAVQNNVNNGLIAYFNPKRYRMYRRLGLTVRVETGGRTLALANTKLLVLRMRWGGQLELGAAAAVMTDAQV